MKSNLTNKGEKRVMKFNEISNECVKKMQDAIKDQLLRLGINVDVTMFAKPNFCGVEYVCVETSMFNVTPAIYRHVTIEGETLIEKRENASTQKHTCYALGFSLDYSLKYWNGAHNGVNLGYTKFMLYVDNADNSQYVIPQGLTIGFGDYRDQQLTTNTTWK